MLFRSRIAVADPSHVPAGKYARNALECLGLWSDIADKLVPTLDVRAALASVESGAIQTSVVYVSDLHRSTLKHFLIDPDCQPSIEYTIGASVNSTSFADSFYHFIEAAEQKNIWTGFDFQYHYRSTVP